MSNTLVLPTTLMEAVDYYVPKFVGFENCFGSNVTEDNFATFCHSQLSGGIGMRIRNELGFWTKNSPIFNHMVEVHKLEHPDSMSDLIIRNVYKVLILNADMTKPATEKLFDF